MKRKPSTPSEDLPIVIVLEDDSTTSQLVCLVLRNAGLQPLPCFTAREAYDLIQTGPRLSALLVDLLLPDGDGIEVIRYARKNQEGLPCFVLTAKNDIQLAVNAIKAGAENYLMKPFEPALLVPTLIDAIKVYRGTHSIWDENFTPPPAIRRWKSKRMREATELAAIAAKSTSTTMIIGASFTGKSRFAELIHLSSKLKKRPMTTLNLAALSPLQIETILFGVPLEKLPEAHAGYKNKLTKCRGQFLYIQNIQRLHPAAQNHLLAIIKEEQEFPKAKLPPCRIISSCPINLTQESGEHEFNQELWYALAVNQIHTPSLTERLEDFPLLCENILTRLCVTRKLKRPTLTRRVIERLEAHNWPGNLSELYNCIEHALNNTRDGLLGPDDFPLLIRKEANDAPNIFAIAPSSIDDLTKATLVATLKACGGNRRRAAQRLKISLRTIYNMIERYELPKRNKPNTLELTET